MRQVQSVVVGVDFTEGCRSALAQARRLAEPLSAGLRAVHFLDPLVVQDLSESLGESVENMGASLIADAKGAWKEFAGPDCRAELEVRVAHPVAGMLEFAKTHKADLLVLATRGASSASTSIGGGGAGVVASACVRKSHCKTLLVRPGVTGAFRQIVAGVDFSPTSLAAVGQAAQLAAIDSATLHIAHAFDPPWQRLHYRSPTPQASPIFRKQFLDGLGSRLRAFCKPALDLAGGVEAQIHLLERGAHGAALVQLVNEVRPELIVLGTRGRTNLRDLLLGSTAERVLRDAPCSVLTIPAE